MKSISCNVINDLLPLYADSIISEDSKTLVEEHLENCDLCRNELSKMKKAMIIMPDTDKTRIKAMKKKVGIRKFIIVTIVMLLSLVLFAILGILWGKLHFDNPYGRGEELANYFVLSALILLSFSSLWYWIIYTVYTVRRSLNKETHVKRACISSACTILAIYCVSMLGFFLAFYGNSAAYDDVHLQTEFQYSDRSYLNQEWVIHFYSKSNKALNIFRKEVYNDEGVVTGIVYTVHEVPVKMLLESKRYTAGYSYGDMGSIPPHSFDFTVTIVFSDKTVVYSMRNEGLFEKQSDVKYTPNSIETTDNASHKTQAHTVNGND